MKTNTFKTSLTIKGSIILLCILLGTDFVSAQTNVKPKMAILNMYTINFPYSPEQLGNLVRLEVEKMDTFQVMDRFDVNYLAELNKVDVSTAFGKINLVEVGSIIKSDKMLTGSFEQFGSSIIVTLRLIDVASGSIERTYVNEYLNIPNEIQAIVHVSIAKMFNRHVESVLYNSITMKSSYDSEINNPNATKLNLSGPRMGFAVQSGLDGRILRSSSPGGFKAYPVLFQFGYQFEKQYLNSGNCQALFEFIPTLTLVNDRKIIPSIAMLNGLRSTKNGWEFACGLTFSFNKKAKGYYDANGKWNLEEDFEGYGYTENPYEIKDRLDSRGLTYFVGGFVVAVGKTFKSGKLNVPVNAYISPGANGCRAGVSFGFNAKKSQE